MYFCNLYIQTRHFVVPAISAEFLRFKMSSLLDPDLYATDWVILLGIPLSFLLLPFSNKFLSRAHEMTAKTCSEPTLRTRSEDSMESPEEEEFQEGKI